MIMIWKLFHKYILCTVDPNFSIWPALAFVLPVPVYNVYPLYLLICNACMMLMKFLNK